MSKLPARVLDINRLPLARSVHPDGGLRIGATVRTPIGPSSTVAPRLSGPSQASSTGLQPNCVTWQPLRAICSSALAACIFATPRWAVQQTRARDGCPTITGANRTLAGLGNQRHCIAAILRHVRRMEHWKRLSTCKGRKSAHNPLHTSTCFPATAARENGPRTATLITMSTLPSAD